MALAIDNPSAPLVPETIHSCPSCSHWLSDGTLACPDCNTLTYGRYLGTIAAEAQTLEREGKFAEARTLWKGTLPWLPEEATQTASVRQHMQHLDQQLLVEEDRRSRWKRRLGPFAPAALFLLKLKSYVFILFKFKFFLSLLAYFAIYWALFGWQFAAGITVSVLIHEMGHYVAAKRRGLKVDLPFFLPGLGAYVRWYSQGTSRAELAAIALAGPLFGLAAAATSYALYWATHLQIFLVICNIGAWINIFNLIPVFGLDGSQAAFALSRLQRGLIAAMAVILFGLMASGFDPTGGQHAHYLLLLVAAGMAYRCFTRDLPEQPHTGTLTYFLALLLVLSLVLHLTPIPTSAGGSAF